MKKLFAKDKATVYGYLSALFLMGFIVAATIIVDVSRSGLPAGMMPISHILRPLFFAGIVFGALSIVSYLKASIYRIILLVVIEILLTMICNYFYAPFQKLFIQYDSVLPAVIVDGRWKRDYNLGYGIVVIETICIQGGGGPFVDIYEGTRIYEQDGTSQQKRRVGVDALQPGQVVDIKFTDLLLDPELGDLVNAKVGRMDTFYLIGAIEITIHKGEFAPVVSNVGISMCEILPN